MEPAAAPVSQPLPASVDESLASACLTDADLVNADVANAGRAKACNARPALACALAPLFALYLDARLTDEVFCVAGCDVRGQLLAFAEQRGDVAHVASALPAVRRILGNPAVTQIVIAHNHVTGSATPSAADKMSTRQIAALAQAAGAMLVDHLLFTTDAIVSFRATSIL